MATAQALQQPSPAIYYQPPPVSGLGQDYDTQYLKIFRHAEPVVSLSSQKKLRSLRTLEANWDGFDSAAPKRQAVDEAISWISQLYGHALNTRLAWKDPNIGANEEGDVVLEWWHKTRKLTLYLTGSKAEYIKVWGMDIFSEMEDGVIASPGEFEPLWAWLVG